jgi:hypothetical protein
LTDVDPTLTTRTFIAAHPTSENLADRVDS